MILLIDNYDSFVYTIASYVDLLGHEYYLIRNDQIDFPGILDLKPESIILSPGPKRPEDHPLGIEIIQNLPDSIPLLGICLGHQMIAYGYAGKITKAKQCLHGKTSLIHHNSSNIFKNMPNPFRATRYHSLAVTSECFPDCLEITAKTKENEIMALQHTTKPVYGVQFHPESIMTEYGIELIKNFLSL